MQRPAAESLISWDEPDTAPVVFQGPAACTKSLTVPPAKLTLSQSALGRSHLMQQQSHKAQSSNSSSLQSAECHASHHLNSMADYSGDVEDRAIAHQTDPRHVCQEECLSQLQACPPRQQLAGQVTEQPLWYYSKGQQPAGQRPEQPLWHYASGQDQRQLLGMVPGSDMPLGLESLQQLNQQHGMSSHTALADSQAASFPSSGSITPEKVVFASQVQIVAFAVATDMSLHGLFLTHLAFLLLY